MWQASFQVPSGHLFALLGPNGAGKTTIMRLIGGILRATEGEIRAFGERITPKTCDRLRSHMGFQNDGSLYQDLTVEENLRFWGELYSLDKKQIKEGIGKLSDMFSFSQYLHQKSSTLSKGTRQKVLIARALLSKPSLLLLDEPTSGLDLQTSKVLFGYMRECIESENVTIVMATHIFQELNYQVDDVAFINKGTVVKTGSVSEIIKKELAKTYEIYVQDSPDALQFLSTVGSMEISKREEGRVDVKLYSPKVELQEIIKKLVLSDLAVYDAHCVQYTVEDLYSQIFLKDNQ